MPELIVKNAPIRGLLKSAVTRYLECLIPPEDDDCIATAQNTSGSSLTLDGAWVTSTNGVLPYPISPAFTFSDTNDVGTITIVGYDQWGNAQTWVVSKTTTGTVIKTLEQTSNPSIPCFSKIDSMALNFTTAAGTVKCGVTYASGNNTMVALPRTFARLSDLKQKVWVDRFDGSFSGGPLPALLAVATPTTTAAGDLNVQRGVLPIVLGTSAATSSATGTFTNATRTFVRSGGAATPFAKINTNWTHPLKVTVTAGTGVTTGAYEIEEVISSTSVVLARDIGGTNPPDVALTFQQQPVTWGRCYVFVDPQNTKDS